MPRRYNDEDDDDDFEDERPRKRASKKKNNTPMILAIVSVVVVVLVLGCGGLVWYAVRETGKKIEEISSAAESEGEAERFLDKLTGEQIQAAYDSTTPAFKTGMSLAQFQQLLKKHPLLTKHDDYRALNFDNPTGVTPNRKKVTSYELTESDDSELDPDSPRPLPKKPKSSPKSLTLTITLAEQPGGLWKVEKLTVP